MDYETAKKIADMGGVCVFYPTPRHVVLFEKSGDGVEVSLDTYKDADSEEPAETRTERFSGVKDALEGFKIEGRPLFECGGEPLPPVTPATPPTRFL